MSGNIRQIPAVFSLGATPLDQRLQTTDYVASDGFCEGRNRSWIYAYLHARHFREVHS